MPKINTIYAFIATEEGPDDEGVVAALISDVWIPLVGADKERVESLKPIAKKIGQVTKKKITLAKFKVREDLEVISERG